MQDRPLHARPLSPDEVTAIWQEGVGGWLAANVGRHVHCKPSYRPQSCSGGCGEHGVCNEASGSCHCSSGWRGRTCELEDQWACNAPDGRYLWSRCAGECDQRYGYCFCGGRALYPDRPLLQVFTCIDERECSFRRHLESSAGDSNVVVETFGVPGFFGFQICFQGQGKEHEIILAPEGAQPGHTLVESQQSKEFTERSRLMAKLEQWWERASFSPVGSLLLSALFPVTATRQVNTTACKSLFSLNSHRSHRLTGADVFLPDYHPSPLEAAL